MTSISNRSSDDSEGAFTLVRWLREDGAVVSSGEIVAEIENAKASVEMEAWDSGVLRHIAKPGDRLTLDTVEAHFARIEPISR